MRQVKVDSYSFHLVAKVKDHVSQVSCVWAVGQVQILVNRIDGLAQNVANHGETLLLG
jgi:hypothetical protein